MKSLLALSLLTLLPLSPAQAAIFGADNRMPVMPNTPFREVSKAVALGVISSMETPAPGGKIDLEVDYLEGGFCPEERFGKDPSMSYGCTGFLIAPDLLLTAGHCAVNVGVSEHETETFCKTYSWLFDYAPGFDGKTQVKGIDAGKMVRCKETIFAASEETAPYRDFAIIRLDRAVTDRKPLKLNFDPVKKSEVLSVVGHPLGSPAKVATQGRVLLNDPTKEKIITTLDVFQGNSGSPVFNSRKEVVGILVGGFPAANFVEDPRGCNRLNRCDENGKNCTVPDTDYKPYPYFQAVGSEVQRLDSMKAILERIQSEK